MKRLAADEERRFLLSFKNREPEWDLLGLDDIAQLPAVRWKMQNLANMAPEKHAKAFEDLRHVLYDY